MEHNNTTYRFSWSTPWLFGFLFTVGYCDLEIEAVGFFGRILEFIMLFIFWPVELGKFL